MDLHTVYDVTRAEDCLTAVARTTAKFHGDGIDKEDPSWGFDLPRALIFVSEIIQGQGMVATVDGKAYGRSPGKEGKKPSDKIFSVFLEYQYGMPFRYGEQLDCEYLVGGLYVSVASFRISTAEKPKGMCGVEGIAFLAAGFLDLFHADEPFDEATDIGAQSNECDEGQKC